MDAFNAIIAGAGCNGLAAAIHLLERGWSVAVIEQAPEPGGLSRHARSPRQASATISAP